MSSVIQIGQGVTVLWGVKNGPFLLLWPVAYTTACTTVQAVMYYRPRVAAADWLQQLCLMNFYVHVAKYATEPKTVLQLFLATLKLFYFSCSHC